MFGLQHFIPIGDVETLLLLTDNNRSSKQVLIVNSFFSAKPSFRRSSFCHSSSSLLLSHSLCSLLLLHEPSRFSKRVFISAFGSNTFDLSASFHTMPLLWIFHRIRANEIWTLSPIIIVFFNEWGRYRQRRVEAVNSRRRRWSIWSGLLLAMSPFLSRRSFGRNCWSFLSMFNGLLNVFNKLVSY